jgi:hypothetical protein
MKFISSAIHSKRVLPVFCHNDEYEKDSGNFVT